MGRFTKTDLYVGLDASRGGNPWRFGLLWGGNDKEDNVIQELESRCKNTERVGFEPTIHLRIFTLSRRAPSAAQTSFHGD